MYNSINAFGRVSYFLNLQAESNDFFVFKDFDLN